MLSNDTVECLKNANYFLRNNDFNNLLISLTDAICNEINNLTVEVTKLTEAIPKEYTIVDFTKSSQTDN